MSGPDYRLCDQTVTVYHGIFGADGSFCCERRVLQGVHFDYTRDRAVDVSGSSPETGFLLVAPCRSPLPAWCEPLAFDRLENRTGRYTLAPGDKILPGVGPEISTRAQWAALTNRTADGLAVVKYVDAKWWQGHLCHVEAGGYRSDAPRRRRD